MQASKLTLTLTSVTLLAFTLVGMVKAAPKTDLITAPPMIEQSQQR